ncbi:hypothetical protein SAMN05216202_2164 [Pseudomonas mucidolens]|uniref:Uncharacterized protein n=1 Tax=Pseudomonas mucidolens TaxID=46679 RepID=A0A1H2MQE5_9PSED|nr:hypothetical protein SAMN05216202_2164 [Pseudomonas mucidolens]SQH33440.1 Uncharacterised protein [Pseudomonas mucidolens]
MRLSYKLLRKPSYGRHKQVRKAQCAMRNAQCVSGKPGLRRCVQQPVGFVRLPGESRHLSSNRPDSFGQPCIRTKTRQLRRPYAALRSTYFVMSIELPAEGQVYQYQWRALPRCQPDTRSDSTSNLIGRSSKTQRAIRQECGLLGSSCHDRLDGCLGTVIALYEPARGHRAPCPLLRT